MTSLEIRRPNRRGQGGRLREDILRAATELLEETGSEDAVTLRAVARRVGISAPSIYSHFPDREAILEDVVAEAVTELNAAVTAAPDGGHSADPVERLRGACQAYLDFAARRPHRYRVLFGRHHQAPDRLNQPKDADELLGAEAFGALVQAVGACTQGRAAPDADPMFDATALWVALHGYATLSASVPAFPWPEQQRLLDALVNRLALGGADTQPSRT